MHISTSIPACARLTTEDASSTVAPILQRSTDWTSIKKNCSNRLRPDEKKSHSRGTRSARPTKACAEVRKPYWPPIATKANLPALASQCSGDPRAHRRKRKCQLRISVAPEKRRSAARRSIQLHQRPLFSREACLRAAIRRSTKRNPGSLRDNRLWRPDSPRDDDHRRRPRGDFSSFHQHHRPPLSRTARA